MQFHFTGSPNLPEVSLVGGFSRAPSLSLREKKTEHTQAIFLSRSLVKDDKIWIIQQDYDSSGCCGVFHPVWLDTGTLSSFFISAATLAWKQRLTVDGILDSGANTIFTITMHQRFKSQQQDPSQQQSLHSHLHYDHSNQQQHPRNSEADVAAGNFVTMAPPQSAGSNSNEGSQFLYYSPKRDANGYDQPPRSAAASLVSIKEPTNLEFFDDLVSEPVLVLGRSLSAGMVVHCSVTFIWTIHSLIYCLFLTAGVDISHLDRNSQFLVCAAGVFGFSLLYGYLQELISVELCGRQLGLFLAMFQFTGYTILAFFLRNFVYAKQQRHKKRQMAARSNSSFSKLGYTHEDESKRLIPDGSSTDGISTTAALSVPLVLYVGLSILRAIDLGMTNLAMQYVSGWTDKRKKEPRFCCLSHGCFCFRNLFHSCFSFRNTIRSIILPKRS